LTNNVRNLVEGVNKICFAICLYLQVFSLTDILVASSAQFKTQSHWTVPTPAS